MEFGEVRYRIFSFILLAIKIIAIFVNIFSIEKWSVATFSNGFMLLLSQDKELGYKSSKLNIIYL